MSEEREVELVAGTIGGITQKKADTWTVAVLPNGSEYSKNLWTKDADLVESLAAKIGQQGAFVCGASYWERNGQQVRSLWIDRVSDGTENVPERVATADAPVQVADQQGNITTHYVGERRPKNSGEMSKDEWARKDSAIHMMAAIKAAAAALTHTLPSDPTPQDLTVFLERCKTLSYAWWQRAEAVRKGDDSDLPFLSEHDDQISYG